MKCSCNIDCDIDEGAVLEIEGIYKFATSQTRCCECEKIIGFNEKYLHEFGVDYQTMEDYESLDEVPDKFIEHYHICLDCKSVRDQFFSNFYYGTIWDELSEYLVECDGQVHEDCIANLTPRARFIVCDIIEELWEKGRDE